MIERIDSPAAESAHEWIGTWNFIDGRREYWCQACGRFVRLLGSEPEPEHLDGSSDER